MVYLTIIILIVIMIISLKIKAKLDYSKAVDEKMMYIRTEVFPDFRRITIEELYFDNYYVDVDDKKYNVSLVYTVGDDYIKRRIEVEELKS